MKVVTETVYHEDADWERVTHEEYEDFYAAKMERVDAKTKLLDNEGKLLKYFHHLQKRR